MYWKIILLKVKTTSHGTALLNVKLAFFCLAIDTITGNTPISRYERYLKNWKPVPQTVVYFIMLSSIMNVVFRAL